MSKGEPLVMAEKTGLGDQLACSPTSPVSACSGDTVINIPGEKYLPQTVAAPDRKREFCAINCGGLASLPWACGAKLILGIVSSWSFNPFRRGDQIHETKVRQR